MPSSVEALGGRGGEMQDLSYAEAGGVMVILDDGSALPWPAGTQCTCFLVQMYKY